MTQKPPRPFITLVSASMMTGVLGSVHAFSVFVPEWESRFAADRSSVSLVYSIALVSLTLAVLHGHRLFSLLPAAAIFIVAGVGAAAGLALSSQSQSLLSLAIFYGVVFGAANGLGYGYALQLSGQAMPTRKGLAMGVVTAFYAAGATLAPLLFSWLIRQGGNALALFVMAVLIFITTCIAAWLVYLARAGFRAESGKTRLPLSIVQKKTRLCFWIGYGGAASAGLMVIGHAYNIAVWSGLEEASATFAVILLSFGNMLGGFVAGYFADRVSSRRILFVLPVSTAAALVTLYAVGDWLSLFVWSAIGITGFCYGALIAVYPVAVSDAFGAQAAARIYGQVFTAWGLAGLLGPWSSGWLYDRTASYDSALLLAATLCVVSAGVTRLFPEKPG